MGALPPTETLSASDVRRPEGPLVYGWRRGEAYRYIGATTRGLRRVIGKHHAFESGGGVAPGDVIDIWVPPPGSDVWKLEAELIREHQPELNRTLVDRQRTVVALAAKSSRPAFRRLPDWLELEGPEGFAAIHVSVVVEFWRTPLVVRDGQVVPVDDVIRYAYGGTQIRRDGDELRFRGQVSDAADIIDAAARYRTERERVTPRRLNDDGVWRDEETGEEAPWPSVVARSADALENVTTWLDVCAEDDERAAQAEAPK